MIAPDRFDVVKASDPIYMRDRDGGEQVVSIVVEDKDGKQLVLVFPNNLGEDLFWKIATPPSGTPK